LDIEIIIFAILVLTLNVLDSVTTHLAFKQYPDKELKSEANPFMRKLMLKNRVLAEVLKQGFVLAVCVFLIIMNDIASIRFTVSLLGLVVLNNTFVIVSRAITKRRVIAPLEKIRKTLQVPEKYSYVMVLVILITLAFTINGVVWG